MTMKLKLVKQLIEILPEDDTTTYPRLNFKLRNGIYAVPAGSENPDDGSIASSFKIGGIIRYIPKEIIKNKMRDLYEDTYQTMTTVPEGLDLSETTTASKMFEGCEALTTVPKLDTSNIINMSNMFNDCPSLESISQLNTSSATKMNSMFEGCSSLPTEFPWAIDCTSITNVNNLQSMFKDSSVTKVRLANVNEELKPQITSQLLKENDNLEIEFVGLVHMDDSNGTMKDLVDPSEYKTMTEVPSELDTSNMTTMNHMFEDCEALVTVPEIDTSKVTDMDNMFNNCSSLKSVPEMDTSNVTTMSNMFNNCSSITGNEEVFNNLDTTKVTNMSGMFTDCTSLTNVPEIDTSNVTNMNSMFEGCTSLPAEFPHRINCSSIEGNNLAEEVGNMFKDSSVTKVQLANVPQELKSSITPQLLKGDDSLTIEFIEVLDNERTIQNVYSSNYQTMTTITDTLDTSKVTNMNSMFKDCSKLTNVPQMNTSKVTSMNSMFSGCKNLVTVTQLDTSKANNMNNMFNGCTSLPATLPIIIDCSSIADTNSISNMFKNSSVTKVYLYNVNESLKSSITSSILKGNDTLEIVFTSSNTSQFYNLTLAGTTNQTITLTYTELGTTAITKTSTASDQVFTVQYGTTWTATVTGAEGYNPGTLSASSGTIIDNTTINISEATVAILILTDSNYKMSNIYPSTYKAMATIPNELDTSNVTDMGEMFNGCRNLKSIPQLNTSKVTNMSSMFDGCESLTTIPQLNTSSVIYMGGMFNSCRSLTTIPELNTSNVIEIQEMFNGCSKLTSIPQLDTSKITNMEWLFSGCSKLTSIPQLDTSNVTNMQLMFEGCGSLTTIPQLNTSKVTNMSSMFLSCGKLTSIPQLDTSKVTNMYYMFDLCESLTTVPQLDTSRATSMEGMFYSCGSLPATFPWPIDCSNISDANNLKDMFKSEEYPEWGISNPCSVTKVTLKNVNDSIKSQITSELLKGDNTLTITFA